VVVTVFYVGWWQHLKIRWFCWWSWSSCSIWGDGV